MLLPVLLTALFVSHDGGSTRSFLSFTFPIGSLAAFAYIMSLYAIVVYAHVCIRTVVRRTRLSNRSFVCAMLTRLNVPLWIRRGRLRFQIPSGNEHMCHAS